MEDMIWERVRSKNLKEDNLAMIQWYNKMSNLTVKFMHFVGVTENTAKDLKKKKKMSIEENRCQRPTLYMEQIAPCLSFSICNIAVI